MGDQIKPKYLPEQLIPIQKTHQIRLLRLIFKENEVVARIFELISRQWGKPQAEMAIISSATLVSLV